MKRISLRALFISNFADIFLSLLLASLMVLYSHSHVRRPGMTTKEITAAAVLFRARASWQALSTGIGLVISILSGSIAGKLAGHDRVLNGAFASTLCSILGLLVMLHGRNTEPMWLQILIEISAILSAAFGGWLVDRRSERA
jgi:hypothetical protein